MENVQRYRELRTMSDENFRQAAIIASVKIDGECDTQYRFAMQVLIAESRAGKTSEQLEAERSVLGIRP